MDSNNIRYCERVDWCLCSANSDSPNEACPIHEGGEWPPRCADCGRFMVWTRKEKRICRVRERLRYGATPSKTR